MDLIEIMQHIRNNWWVLPVTIVSAYALGYAGARFSSFTSSNLKPQVAIVEQVVEKPFGEDASLELRVDECSDNIEWDKRNLKGLLETAKTSKVTMFGLDHGRTQGDVRDGQFVAGLLSNYHKLGWNYVAIEGPTSLNAYAGSEEFEEKVRETYDGHWTELSPIFTKATELGMKIVFYDPLGEFTNEREKSSFNYLKENVFEKYPEARVIVCCGINHAFEDETRRSFIFPEMVKPLGMHLHKYFDGNITRVLLQPEDPAAIWWHFDHSFYLGKQCAGERKTPVK